MENVRGKPFLVGNTQGRGRPKGSPNKMTALWRELTDQYAPSLMRKCIAEGLLGHPVALRLCMERMLAPLRNAPVHLTLPSVATLAGIAEAIDTVLRAVSRGDLTPEQAETMANILEIRRRAVESGELQVRVKQLEDLAA